MIITFTVKLKLIEMRMHTLLRSSQFVTKERSLYNCHWVLAFVTCTIILAMRKTYIMHNYVYVYLNYHCINHTSIYR